MYKAISFSVELQEQLCILEEMSTRGNSSGMGASYSDLDQYGNEACNRQIKQKATLAPKHQPSIILI